MQTTLDRFMAKVKVDESTGCWEWQASKQNKGYGQLSFQRNGKTCPKLSHRVSYELFVGPVDGTCVLHSCDNPGCVNPYHLFQGTQKDNMKDKLQKGRQARGEAQHNSKLTEKEVFLIKEFLKRFPVTIKNKSIAFGSATFLANWFGVAKCTISAISSGRKWPHIN